MPSATTPHPRHADSRAAAPSAWGGPLAIIAATAATAAIGGLASARASDFYLGLQRPGWAPPAWLFGPVWTTLYLLMAIAAWLVWRVRERRGARHALTLYGVQLALNALWPWLFFAWRRGALASLEIVILLGAILATIAAFARVRRRAAVLLVPYLLWVSYATALTVAVWRANPGRL